MLNKFGIDKIRQHHSYNDYALNDKTLTWHILNMI